VLSLTDDTRELQELLYSLGYDIAGVVVQKRGRADTATFLGSGKTKEVQELLRGANGRAGASAGEALQRAERSAHVGAHVMGSEARGEDEDAAPGARGDAGHGDQDGPMASMAAGGPIPLVAVNAHLKPSQVAGLERLFGVDVYDRVRVILEIFTQRAHTREAQLQVELARLRYERPLVREYIHLAKRGEHPGFMAGGAYAVDVYYASINGRISRIQEELARIAKERGLRRRHRRRGGFQLVSLAGYTNAGKSSLLKRLSGEDVLVENRMFSTLETRTGKAEAQGRRLLVTDTVGFVDGLPPDLVQAFRSTLEEIAQADCIVLVCDGSDRPPEIARKLGTSARVLRDLEGLAPIVLALNKADLVPAHQRQAAEDAARASGIAKEGAWTWLSAMTGEGMDRLEALILQHVPPWERVAVRLPPTQAGESLLGELYDIAVVHRAERGATLDIEAEGPAAQLRSWLRRAEAAGGEHLLAPAPSTAALPTRNEMG
jgi:GTP-binding protein HflX